MHISSALVVLCAIPSYVYGSTLTLATRRLQWVGTSPDNSTTFSNETTTSPASIHSDAFPSTTSLRRSKGSPPSIPTLYPNITSQDPTCLGIDTYIGSVPPTVFVTVTESFEVTITANASVTSTASDILITPPPACSSTILSASGSGSESEPDETTLLFNSLLGLGRQSASRDRNGFAPDGRIEPQRPPQTEKVSATLSPVNSQVDYTSTVIITKKTPVTVIVPPSSSPGVDFGGRQSDSRSGNDRNQDQNGDDSISTPNSIDNHQDPNGKEIPSDEGTTGRSGLGDIVVSLIYSGQPNPAPNVATTTVGNVPVVVGSSSVVIGGVTVALPTSRPTSINVGGVDYLVGPSEIVAPSATIAIPAGRQDQPQGVITPPPKSTVLTTMGLTLTAGPSLAVVSGTTYRIGSGAPSTSITVDGSVLSIGSNGIGLPASGTRPGASFGNPYVVYTVDGLTISVNQGQAVISGTTYRIASGAAPMTTVIGSRTIAFGTNGVALASTTIAPTKPSSQAAAASSTSVAQESNSESNTGIKSALSPFSRRYEWCLCLLLSYMLV